LVNEERNPKLIAGLKNRVLHRAVDGIAFDRRFAFGDGEGDFGGS
jgi:hypothetical protein